MLSEHLQKLKEIQNKRKEIALDIMGEVNIPQPEVKVKNNDIFITDGKFVIRMSISEAAKLIDKVDDALDAIINDKETEQLQPRTFPFGITPFKDYLEQYLTKLLDVSGGNLRTAQKLSGVEINTLKRLIITTNSLKRI